MNFRFNVLIEYIDLYESESLSDLRQIEMLITNLRSILTKI